MRAERFSLAKLRHNFNAQPLLSEYAIHKEIYRFINYLLATVSAC